jgi:PadR family transcriptional regulator PadR
MHHMVVEGGDRQASLMRGVLDMCVLAVLDVEPLHAYGVVSRLREHGFADAGYGTIYPLVTRLKKQRLVDERMEPGASGPTRKVLTVNADGRSALAEWVEQWHRTTGRVTSILAARDGKVEEHAHGV